MMKKNNEIGNLLVISGSAEINELIATLVAKAEYKITQTESFSKAKTFINSLIFDLILFTIPPSAETGEMVATIKDIRETSPHSEILILGDTSESTELLKPLNSPQIDFTELSVATNVIIQQIQKKIRFSRMTEELFAYKTQIAMSASFDNIVGISEEILQLKEKLMKISDTEIPILITGPSGTGKTLSARTIHYHSSFRNRAFHLINCETQSETTLTEILYSENSGLTKDGTLYLKQVDKMPLPLQEKLAKALTSYNESNLHFNFDINNIRVIASSTQSLSKMTVEKKFSKELFHFLNQMPLVTSALSERMEDLEISCQYFLRLISPLGDIMISPEAVDKLLAHNWPNNLTELKEVLSKAAAICRNKMIDLSDIRFTRTGAEIYSETKAVLGSITDMSINTTEEAAMGSENSLADNQKNVIIKVLDDNNWNYTQSAQKLGIGRTTLWRKIRKYDLKREIF